MANRFKTALDIWQQKTTDAREVNAAFNQTLQEAAQEGRDITEDPAWLLLRNYLAKLLDIAPYTEEEMQELIDEIPPPATTLSI